MRALALAAVVAASMGCGAIVGVEDASLASPASAAGTATGTGGDQPEDNEGGGGDGTGGIGAAAPACDDHAGVVAHYRAGDLRVAAGQPVTSWPSTAAPYGLFESPEFGNVPPEDGGSAPILVDTERGHRAVRFAIVDPEPIPPTGKALLAMIPPAEFSAASDPAEPELTLFVVLRHSGVESGDQPLTALHYGEPSANLAGLKLVIGGGKWRFELRYGGRIFPSTDRLVANDVQVIEGPAATTSWTVMSARKHVASFSFRVDGALIDEQPMKHPTMAITNPELLVGASNGYQHFDGDIAEILIHRGALDEDAIESVEGCLAERYGIPIAL